MQAQIEQMQQQIELLQKQLEKIEPRVQQNKLQKIDSYWKSAFLGLSVQNFIILNDYPISSE